MDTLNEATKPDIIADVDAPAVVISENNAEVDLIIKEFEDELQAKVFTVILLIIYMFVCSMFCCMFSKESWHIFSISRVYVQKQDAKMRLSERLSQLEDFLITQPVIEVAGEINNTNYQMTETMLEKWRLTRAAQKCLGFLLSKNPPVKKDHKDVVHVYVLFDVISVLKHELISHCGSLLWKTHCWSHLSSTSG